jgi:Zn-dependent M28 family amino/carboxypeptidase
MKTMIAGTLLVLVAACDRQPPQAGLIPTEVQAAAQAGITPNLLAAPVRYLADDLLGGRGVASEGDKLARLYLSTQLQQLGYQPGAGSESWFQTVDMVGVKAHVPASWSFKSPRQAVTLKWYTDFIAASGTQQPTAGFSNAEVVFVGYGIQAPEFQWDDFKGSDLKGKVLLMLNNDPDWDPALFAGNTRLYYGRWDYKYDMAARLGAAAAIIIHTRPSAGYPWQVVQTSWSGEQFELPHEGEARLQVRSWVTEGSARALLKAGGFELDTLVAAARKRDFTPVNIGLRTSLALQNTLTRVSTANVVGMLPGSDAQLRDEYVVYTAHHDHLGVGEPDKSGDKIYNGALDNAAGCAQVLAIARSIAALPVRPRRSTLILFVAAEEQGLLGAKYYAKHPTVPPGRIAANLNIDGGSIWGRARDVTMIGMGKSTVDDVAQSVAKFQGRVLKPDQFPDRGHFYRSDQFAFAQIGVPALYFDVGTEVADRPAGWGKEQIEKWEDQQYHQPSDQLDASWNFDGMVEDVRLAFYTGWLIGNADAMPSWRKGDEFEAARIASIASLNVTKP